MFKINLVIKSLRAKLKGKGFFEILISSTLVKVIMFLSAMFLPRFLSVSDYGILTYAETILNYLFRRTRPSLWHVGSLVVSCGI